MMRQLSSVVLLYAYCLVVYSATVQIYNSDVSYFVNGTDALWAARSTAVLAGAVADGSGAVIRIGQTVNGETFRLDALFHFFYIWHIIYIQVLLIA